MKRGEEEVLSRALRRVALFKVSMVARMEEELARRQERDKRCVDEDHDWFGLNHISR